MKHVLYCFDRNQFFQGTKNGINHWGFNIDEATTYELLEAYSQLQKLIEQPHHKNVTVQTEDFQLGLYELNEK